MHESIGGIQPTFEHPGYKHFTLKPHLTSRTQVGEDRHGVALRHDPQRLEEQPREIRVDRRSPAKLQRHALFPLPGQGGSSAKGIRPSSRELASSKKATESGSKTKWGPGLLPFLVRLQLA